MQIIKFEKNPRLYAREFQIIRNWRTKNKETTKFVHRRGRSARKISLLLYSRVKGIIAWSKRQSYSNSLFIVFYQHTRPRFFCLLAPSIFSPYSGRFALRGFKLSLNQTNFNWLTVYEIRTKQKWFRIFPAISGYEAAVFPSCSWSCKYSKVVSGGDWDSSCSVVRNNHAIIVSNDTNGRRSCGVNLYNELYKAICLPKNIDFISNVRKNCSFFASNRSSSCTSTIIREIVHGLINNKKDRNKTIFFYFNH